ncbi:MAG: hypothetical protein GX638_00110 [Crenarchaeota archaeon]|nr:hypothetical protein [Thermoproteota archaeon]
MNIDEICINKDVMFIYSKRRIIQEALSVEVCPSCGCMLTMDCREPALICTNKDCRMFWPTLYSIPNKYTNLYGVRWDEIRQLSPESGYYK